MPRPRRVDDHATRATSTRPSPAVGVPTATGSRSIRRSSRSGEGTDLDAIGVEAVARRPVDRDARSFPGPLPFEEGQLFGHPRLPERGGRGPFGHVTHCPEAMRGPEPGGTQV